MGWILLLEHPKGVNRNRQRKHEASSLQAAGNAARTLRFPLFFYRIYSYILLFFIVFKSSRAAGRLSA
jgi:hypothetical protein